MGSLDSMTARIRIILAIILVCLMLLPLTTLAVDVSDANYEGTIIITNNGTETVTNTRAVFNLNSQDSIDLKMLDAQAVNCTIQQGGSDIKFMPSYDGHWATFVDSINPNQSLYQYLYTQGINGVNKVTYMPSESGLIVADNSSVEIGANFTLEITGYTDTSAISSVNKSAVQKPGVTEVLVANNGTIAFRLGASVNCTGVATLAQSGVGGWDPLKLIDGSTGTHGFDTDTAALNSVVEIDFGPRQEIALTSFDYYWGKGSLALDATWDIQKSSDNVTWITVSSNLSCGGDTSGWRQTNWSENGTARYWRSLKTNSAQVNGGYHNELRVGGWMSTTYANSVSNAEHIVTVNQSSSVYFDGSGDYIDCGAGVTLPESSSNFSVEVCFSSNVSSRSPFVARWSTAADYDWFFEKLDDGTLRALIMNNAGAIHALAVTTANFTDNNPHYIVMTWDMGKELSVYVDKVLVATDTTFVGTKKLGGAPVWIGADNNGPYYYRGVLDWVHIYKNRVLTQADITLAYDYGVFSTTNMTGRWEFHEGKGSIASDTSGNGNNGALKGDTAWRPGFTSIAVDSLIYDYGIGANVTNTNDAWRFGLNRAMPYIDRIKVSVGGTQVLNLSWAFNDYFYDQSGHGNTGIPTFPITSSNSYISVNLTSFNMAGAIEYPPPAGESGWQLLTELPTNPGNLYTEIGGTGATFIGAGVLYKFSVGSGIPLALIVFPYVFGISIMLGLLVWWITRGGKKGGQQGSLIAMALTNMAVMIYFIYAGGGIIPMWVLIPFAVEAVTLAIWRKTPQPF